MTTKLVSNGQGLEIARMARDMGLSRAVFQTALTGGTVEEFLRGLIPSPLEYPGFVREHLTPKLEKPFSDPGKVRVWLDPRQTSNSLPNGHEVYEAVKRKGLLEHSLSFGELNWYKANPDCIPADWREKGLWVYGWASVCRSSNGRLYVPRLRCDSTRPFVGWHWLDLRWHAYEVAGLRASSS